MAETIQNTDNLLDLTKITEPFDLATALRYMKENGEFIRCKNASNDFYMYRDVQKRPVIVNGRRQFKDVEIVWAFNQWGGTTTTINVTDLFNQEFYIMKFDEEGNPDWTDPTVEPKE
jgi:raw score 30.78